MLKKSSKFIQRLLFRILANRHFLQRGGGPCRSRGLDYAGALLLFCYLPSEAGSAIALAMQPAHD